ncbi:MAG: hypothetical protein ACI9MR_002408 [Myxococcota bacterium]|jgi:hypothetical protein
MHQAVRILTMSALAALTFSATVSAGPPAAWQEFKSDQYGFKMRLPEGATMDAKTFESGWEGLFARAGDDEFYAVTKPGAKLTRQQIEVLGRTVIGIPATNWRTTGSAENELGFKWYRTVRAREGDQMVYARYGDGPKGPYVMVLKTSEERSRLYWFAYLAWGRSIQVY